MKTLNGQDVRIAVLGLGYVGLPLAAAFAAKFSVTGFDISRRRIEELSAGVDRTLEVSAETLKTTAMRFTADLADIADANIYIVTVPTPIDAHKNPDLTPLIKASETVGKVLKQGDVVIYESTVYPGCTEEDCVPVLERVSGLAANRDFFYGYSPERINPGDKARGVADIKKVTSGSTPETGRLVNELYASIITAGTHLAPSVKVAEAAKVIENTQRDINIALMNELALIFDKMGISTNDVLDAAATKWNFLRFEPGLVGGHCIGVDPYYLTFKAQAIGYIPNMILSGRKINDGMGKYVAEKTVKLMIKNGFAVKNSRILLAGITFKENCPDIRNTRVIDIYHELKEYGVVVDVYDPAADADEVHEEYGISMVARPAGKYDAVIVAVKHAPFYAEFSAAGVQQVLAPSGVFIDVKGIITDPQTDAFTYWRL